MALRFERHPLEAAARGAAMELRRTIEPIEQACAALGRIALIRFANLDAEIDFAVQLRQAMIAGPDRGQRDAEAARAILKGITELERVAHILASSKK